MPEEIELTYKYRIYPTKQQATDIMRTCSCVRYLYNKLLEERTKSFKETGEWNKLDPSPYSSMSFFEQIDPGALSWAQASLETAYKKFFHTMRTQPDKYRPEAIMRANTDPNFKLKDTDLISYPRFKKKKTTKETYTTFIRDLEIRDGRFLLPSVGSVKIRYHRPLPEGARQASCTILKKPSGYYYLLIRFKLPKEKKLEDLDSPLGVVYAPGKLAVRSDGALVPFRHQDEKTTKQIQKLQRALKRRVPGSHGYEETRIKLAKVYEHRVNQRRDDLHKAARQITNAGDTIYLQRPEVRVRLTQMQDKKAREIQMDEAWWTFSDMIRYKAEQDGKQFWAVVSAYPLFKICSKCGNLSAEMPKDGQWICPACSCSMPATENAAKNLEELAVKYIRERKEELATNKK